jgi:hypothetical protein
MAHQSDSSFRTFHALRIKGFAKTDVVAEVAGLPEDQVAGHLQDLLGKEHAAFREARGLWQLTPAGREAHGEALIADMLSANVGSALKGDYDKFLHINESFKALCGDWQLRDGNPNDHTDATYDKGVLERLIALDAEAQPVVQNLATVMGRLSHYSPRLTGALGRLLEGQTNMFTGVMCNSYHDVWMELHEDLILSQGIDRAAEGSF